jgi:hypothetical protein
MFQATFDGRLRVRDIREREQCEHGDGEPENQV